MMPWERKVYITQILQNMEREKSEQGQENNLLAPVWE